MKADCPRAFKSCTIKLASRTPGQRAWSELLKKARTATREAGAWVQPRSRQASQGWSVEASKWAQHRLSWEAVVPKGSPHSFGAVLTEKRNVCRWGWGQGHSTDVSLAALCLPYSAAIRKGRSCVPAAIAWGWSCFFCSQILHKASVWHSGKTYPNMQQWWLAENVFYCYKTESYAEPSHFNTHLVYFNTRSISINFTSLPYGIYRRLVLDPYCMFTSWFWAL